MKRLGYGWRDDQLAPWHGRHGYSFPADGMYLPHVEYDRGRPVGLLNYVWRGDDLPRGKGPLATYRAFMQLADTSNTVLPFLTARYDPDGWAMKLFPHNPAARELLDGFGQTLGRRDRFGWTTCTEQMFAAVLYRMRGRQLPSAGLLERYGHPGWSTAPWKRYDDDVDDFTDAMADQDQGPWPGARMSAHRREYQTLDMPYSKLVPCMDLDLALVGASGSLTLVVDYKQDNAKVNLTSTNAQAMAGLRSVYGEGFRDVPALVTMYDTLTPIGRGTRFRVAALNGTGWNLLSFVLGHYQGTTEQLAAAVAAQDFVPVTQRQWLALLGEARAV